MTPSAGGPDPAVAASRVRCEACGARRRDQDVGDDVVVVYESEIAGLRALFADELWRPACDACGEALPLTRSIVSRSDDPPALEVLLGSAASDGTPETVVAHATLPEDRPCAGHRNTDEFAAAVARRLKARAAKFNEAALAIADGRLGEFLQAGWRLFDAEAFSAAAVASLVHVPGMQVVTASSSPDTTRERDPEPATRQLGYLGMLQGKVWLSLCMSWMTDGTHSDSFQDDLDRFVLNGPVLPGAAERFDDSAAALLEVEDIASHTRYAVRALRAGVHTLVSSSDPDPDGWARSLVALELACRRAEHPVAPKYQQMRISAEFARATVGYDDALAALSGALRASMRRLTKDGDGGTGTADVQAGSEALTDLLPVLEEIGQFLGHPDLAATIMVGLGLEADADDILRVMSTGEAAGVRDVDAALYFVRRMDTPLLRDRRVEELERLADGLITRFPDRDAQAAVETWLGSRLKLLRRPETFLARVGDRPRSWESGLAPNRRAALLTERSNALRLAGRQATALDVARLARDALPDDATARNVAVADLNIAILLRETGAPDAALTIFTRLAATGSPGDRLDALVSQATTLGDLHRGPEAVVALEAALALAVGPHAEREPAVRAGLANALAGSGRFDRAHEHLRRVLDTPDATDPMVALPATATLLHLVAYAPELLSDTDLPRASDLLLAVLRTAADNADARVACDASISLAMLADFIAHEDAEPLWTAARDVAHEFAQPPAPEVLLRLAAFAYDRDDLAAARALLDEIPAVLHHGFGRAHELSVVASASNRLRHGFARLAASVLAAIEDRDGTPWGDLRRVADLGRNALARTLAEGRNEPEADIGWPDDHVVGTLADPHRTVGVVEWIETDQYVVCMLTTVRPDGSVRSAPLRWSEQDPFVIAAELPSIVRGWRRGRAGDPLETPQWQEVSAWWRASLSAELDDGDHVVVLEHPLLLGLPWQHACGRRWSCSFAAGWHSLLRRPPARTVRGVGVLRVPKLGDTEEVRGALVESATRARRLADRYALAFETVEDTAADASSAIDLLAATDAVVLLCHGYVDPHENEVGIVVSYDGDLPLRHSVAAGTPRGRRHRLDWSALQGVDRAPAVIFSLACLSGVTYFAGLGERLGLFTAMAPAGMRALVAPRWEIPPREVAPILDATLEAWLGGLDLSRALHQACSAAAETLPPRYAWALMLEGDWR